MENENNNMNSNSFRVVSDSYQKNNFNYSNNSSNKLNKGGFGRSVFVPLLSGALGCALVLGTCFGVPSIREELISGNYVQTSTPSTNSSNSNTGTVTQVNLSNYSDTAIYAANKILPSIVGIEIEYTV